MEARGKKIKGKVIQNVRPKDGLEWLNEVEHAATWQNCCSSKLYCCS